MNLTALLAFESVIYPGLQNMTIKSFVTESLREILNLALLEVTSTLMIMISCRYEGVLHFMGDIMFNLRDMQNMTLQLMEQNYQRPLRVDGLRLFNFMLVDSLDGFLDLEIASYVKHYDTNEYTYIFLQQRDHLVAADMQAVFEYCWRHNMINCNVQTQSASAEIKMFTYFPYTAEHCNHVVPAQINAFVPGRGWHLRQQRLFPNKLRNFHECPLVVAVRDLPPFLNVYNVSSGSGSGSRNESSVLSGSCHHHHMGIGLRLGGFEGCLMVELANYMNFTINATLLDVDDRTGEYCCGIMSWLREHKVDFGIGYFRKRTFMSVISTNVFPHYQNEIVAAIYLNAHNLTTYQILLHPFDGYTWLGAFIALTFAFICAEFIYQHDKRTPGFTQRRFLTFPTLVGATLGMVVTREPRTLKNRILFSSTIWTTFLLRGIYTGILYSIFRDSIHRTLPRNTFDLLQHNYVAVLNTYALKDIKDLPDLGKFNKMRSIILNGPDELAAFPILQEHGTELYFSVSAKEYLVYYGTKYQLPGKFYILPRNVKSQQLCIYLVKHSFLVNQMDVTIMRFHAAGIMQFLRERTLSDKYFKSNHLYGKKLINQRDLMAIYILMGLLQFVAFVVLLLELVWSRLASRRLPPKDKFICYTN